MLTFKQIQMRNFLSFGNCPQLVELDVDAMTLIMGINNDSPGEASESRNGVGKSSIIQGLHFALYGKSIENNIKVNNLVNKTNKKNCEVEVQFQKDGITYTIQRGRNPAYLKFLINGANSEENQAQGENKDTQKEIQDIIGMSQELFTQIVTLTTSADSFLSAPANRQRFIIEELLTITKLSEKAEKLKELNRNVRESIDREKFKISTLESSNEKILNTIYDIENTSLSFEKERKENISNLTFKSNELNLINFDSELTKLEQNDLNKEINNKIQSLKTAVANEQNKSTMWIFENTKKIQNIQKTIDTLNQVDIQSEMDSHDNIKLWEELHTILIKNQNDYKTSTIRLQSDERVRQSLLTDISKLEKQLQSAKDEKCPFCLGALNSSHTHLTDKLYQQLTEKKQALDDLDIEIEKQKNEIKTIDIFDMPPKPETFYKNRDDANLHLVQLAALQDQKSNIELSINPHLSTILDLQKELDLYSVKEMHDTLFKDQKELFSTKNELSNIQRLIQENTDKINPYTTQIESLYSTIQQINYDEINRLKKILEHQEFLIKLLTDKNSFVRKIIIDKNLSFINNRLNVYMNKASSQHTITIINDLSTEITKMGETYDFDNLSRGERNRVTTSLALAFRDIFESLNYEINSLFIDEYFDQGMDPAGTIACYNMVLDLSKSRNKNCFLITHKEELLSKSSNVISVIMENGFSTLQSQNED